MTFNELLAPLFSYVAHAADALGPGTAVPYPAIVDGIKALERAAREHPAAARPGFNTAWSAFAIWAVDALAPSPELAESLRNHFAMPPAPRTQFFRQLHRLLTVTATSPDPRVLEVIEVHARCLDLGFAHAGATPAVLTRLDAVVTRCRRASLPSTPPEEPCRPAPELPPVYGYWKRLIPWLLPPAVTTLLYVVCRLHLFRLYADVMG